ncbi:hypothetical protein J1N35_013387 [Gossypium stocksii]|uniref:Uncharacterized protein n=1 Tax=Gossypium stocksii TaxID=47602 RepID=A0A9D3VUU8_9ROSI|nr:hypothetical protein J1N35_013387 [Gossypium stocksii]
MSRSGMLQLLHLPPRSVNPFQFHSALCNTLQSAFENSAPAVAHLIMVSPRIIYNGNLETLKTNRETYALPQTK